MHFALCMYRCTQAYNKRTSKLPKRIAIYHINNFRKNGGSRSPFQGFAPERRYQVNAKSHLPFYSYYFFAFVLIASLNPSNIQAPLGLLCHIYLHKLRLVIGIIAGVIVLFFLPIQNLYTSYELHNLLCVQGTARIQPIALYNRAGSGHYSKQQTSALCWIPAVEVTISIPLIAITCIR